MYLHKYAFLFKSVISLGGWLSQKWKIIFRGGNGHFLFAEYLAVLLSFIFCHPFTVILPLEMFRFVFRSPLFFRSKGSVLSFVHRYSSLERFRFFILHHYSSVWKAILCRHFWPIIPNAKLVRGFFLKCFIFCLCRICFVIFNIFVVYFCLQ